MSWLELNNKTVVITGGTGGIGGVTAKAFVNEGCSVLVTCMHEEKGRELVRILSKGPGKAYYSVCDVSKVDSVSKTFDYAREVLGRVDVLINNAGINIPRRLVDPKGVEELSEDVWDKITAVNQKGPFLCSQRVVRDMLADGLPGVIINVSSEAGSEGSEGQSAYAATKAALYAMTRSWAKELGREGIRVVGIAPGVVEETPLRSKEYERALAYARDIGLPPAISTGYVDKNIPLKRVGRLSEIADTILFLASDRAAYLHGTVVNVSGGKSRA